MRVLGFLKNNVFAWRRFWKSFDEYQLLVNESGESIDFREKLLPCIYDATTSTPMEPTYFYQDSWAFEQILRRKPKEHVDVGSHHTFVAFLSKITSVTMVDIRPLDLEMGSINFKQGSILSLPFENESLQSVSSLCVVEHIGLGRYGDELDPLGSEKAIDELRRVLLPGGYLYLSLPIDSHNTLYFNAHRAFSEQYLKQILRGFTFHDRKYIYGKRFLDSVQGGFGVACYVLQKKE